jgi:cobyrinic acid a,c-diamide synthase
MDVPDDTVFAYKTQKSNGKQSKSDGVYKKNVLASYAHVHFSSNPELAKNILSAMIKASRNKLVAERT